MKQSAFAILLTQKRFDLIFKYVYAKHPCAYTRFAYLESIRAFNGFYELNPSDGEPKNSAEDFINSFDRLICSLKKDGFSSSKEAIPIGQNGELSDGAHRLAASAALGLEVETTTDEYNEWYPYAFFRKNQMVEDVMDFGALEYVKLNPNAYIVNLHAVTDTDQDDKVLEILGRYGFVYYSKSVSMTYTGYVNLKKISYGSFWEQDNQWIGGPYNQYAGAQDHARESRGKGKNPLRVFVFVCDSVEKVVKAKAEIRALYNIGNFSVHINDTHEEAIWLAEAYFNANTLFFINHRPFNQLDEVFENNIQYLKDACQRCCVNIEDVCGAGSTPLNAFFVRHSDDLDYLSLDERLHEEDEIISPHDSQLQYYPVSKEEIITNPQYHFYYEGMKFISLQVLYDFKKKRGEYPKDYNDCKTIKRIGRKPLITIPTFTWKIFREVMHKNRYSWFVFRCFRKMYRITLKKHD